jgi:hypothetical protein
VSVVAVFCSEGMVTATLLIICTCAYLTRVPRIKGWFFSEKTGYKGVLYKGALSAFPRSRPFKRGQICCAD